jgi:lysophospholipase L1-like esterase
MAAASAVLLAATLALPELCWPAIEAAGVSTKSTSKRTASRRRRSRPVSKVSAQARFQATEQVNGYLQQSPLTTIESPGTLVPFFEQLYRQTRENGHGPVRILQFGDSHTAADVMTGELRTLFQGQFGNGGSGFVYAGRPWRGYRRFDVNIGTATGWVTDNSNRWGSDGLYGLGGVTVTARRTGARMSLGVECRRLEVLYLKQPDGGDFEVLDQGQTLGRVSTAGDFGPGYFDISVEPGPHRFEIRTLNRRSVRLIGWVTEKGQGVTYETLGINGAQASVFMKWDDALLESNLARRDPALVVLAYGTNEAGMRDWDTTAYRDLYLDVIHRIRNAVPASSILVVGPPDREYRSRTSGWTPFNRLDDVIGAQREAALESGCAFWDLRARMGGKGAMAQWVTAGLAQNDHVHFTAPGYKLIAGALFEEIMVQYRTFELLRNGWTGQEQNGKASKDSGDHQESGTQGHDAGTR